MKYYYRIDVEEQLRSEIVGKTCTVFYEVNIGGTWIPTGGNPSGTVYNFDGKTVFNIMSTYENFISIPSNQGEDPYRARAAVEDANYTVKTLKAVPGSGVPT